MKRIVIGLLLLAAMLTGMMSVHATGAEISVQVCVSDSAVKVGDTVEYTVLATGSDVVALQFNLKLPEGLRYVPNSGTTPEGLADRLGVAAAEWTEQTMMFTFFNDVGVTIASGTELLSFSCIAEQEGAWNVELFELFPFNSEFQEFQPELQVQTLQVAKTAAQPDLTEPTQPDTTVSPTPELPTDPEPTEGAAQPNSPANRPEDQPDGETVPDTAPQRTEPTLPPDGQLTVPEDGTPTAPVEPPLEEPGVKIRTWLLPTVGVTLIACGVVVFLIIKKKHS